MRFQHNRHAGRSKILSWDTHRNLQPSIQATLNYLCTISKDAKGLELKSKQTNVFNATFCIFLLWNVASPFSVSWRRPSWPGRRSLLYLCPMPRDTSSSDGRDKNLTRGRLKLNPKSASKKEEVSSRQQRQHTTAYTIILRSFSETLIDGWLFFFFFTLLTQYVHAFYKARWLVKACKQRAKLYKHRHAAKNIRNRGKTARR